MNNKIVLTVGAFILLIVLFAIFGNSDQTGNGTGADADVIPVDEDPVDTVIDFYSAWNRATRATDTDPYRSGLASYGDLSGDLQTTLAAGLEDYTNNGTDLVLCGQGEVERLRTKTIYRSEAAAQIMLLSKGEDFLTPVSIVDLRGENGEWRISKIDCNASETAPEMGEFSFERTGFLLKQSVQPPLDPDTWYLVYEDDGLLGFTAALGFDENSACSDSDGSALSCDDSGLQEVMEVEVQGNMSEAGVEVVNLQVVN